MQERVLAPLPGLLLERLSVQLYRW